MQSMEQQLAGLSTLVHTALMSKGTSEAVFKDIEMLRREILGNNRAGPSDIDTSSEAGSVSRFSGTLTSVLFPLSLSISIFLFATLLLASLILGFRRPVIVYPRSLPYLQI